MPAASRHTVGAPGFTAVLRVPSSPSSPFSPATSLLNNTSQCSRSASSSCSADWRRWRVRRYQASWQTVGQEAAAGAQWIRSGACVAAVPKLTWGPGMFAVLTLTGLSIAFRMAPLLAITTELVTPSERGTFLALRNALSQLGIAASTLSASYLFCRLGIRVGWSFSRLGC